MSGSLLGTLGVSATLGRTISSQDDRAGANGPVLMISDAFWRRQFGAAPDVVGRTVTLNGTSVTIIGITPPRFSGLDVGRTFDVLVPLADEPVIDGPQSALRDRLLEVQIVGRLTNGETKDGATAELRAIQPRLREIVRSTDQSGGRDPFMRDYLIAPLTLVPAARGNPGLIRRYVAPLWMVLGAALVVLLVACGNVGALILARTAARRHEMAVRVALGASRGRLIHGVLWESVLVAGGGATLAFVAATWTGNVLARELSTATTPVFIGVVTDRRLAAFATALTVVTVIVCGLVPALRASAADPIDALKADHRNVTAPARSDTLGALVVSQTALSLVLVVIATLFVRSLVALDTRDLGFARNVLLVGRINSERALPDLCCGSTSIRRSARPSARCPAWRTLPCLC